MPKPPLAHLSARERRRIQRICFALFARHGYDHTSMKMITGSLKVADGYLYYYFEGKLDLVHWLIDVGLEKWSSGLRKNLEEQAPEDVYELFKLTLVQTVRFIRKNRDLFGMYFKFINDPDFPLILYLGERVAELDSNYVDHIRRGMQNGRFRSDICPDTAGMVFDVVAVRIHNFVFNPALDPLGVATMNDDDLEKLVEKFVTVFDKGIDAAS
ncbi:MAG: TetR/AcrR family transcriptional regulator [Candidatus Lernaella stagnicola]|nr:TetR/AcrR family transcriptional regulator [Candidatus Lernaella stagnicola]